MGNIEPLALDLREELRSGGEPLARILTAVNVLKPGQALRLLTTFEPLPLYAVLARKGFGHQAVRRGQADWEVLFTPGETPETLTPKFKDAPIAHAMARNWPAPSTFLDNRGLQPPEPLVRILDALEHLGPGEVLEAINERDPVFLYPELEARGAAIHTEKQADGVRLLIRHAE